MEHGNSVPSTLAGQGGRPGVALRVSMLELMLKSLLPLSGPELPLPPTPQCAVKKMGSAALQAIFSLISSEKIVQAS